MAWSRRLILTLFVAAACRDASAATVLLDFMSPSCGPCRTMQPIMRQLSAAGFDVRQIDTSREPGASLGRQHKVQELPTFIVVVDGRERARLTGSGHSVAAMAEMIHKATEIAKQAAVMPIARTEGPATDEAAQAELAVPQPGRVVPIQAQPPVKRSTPSSAEVGARTSTDQLIASTVRISIDDQDGKSTGTGTIIDSREGKALVLTCGHLFRSSGGKGPIEISLFTPGPNGAELKTTVEGMLIDFDLERDLALVCFAPEGDVTVTPLAPQSVQTAVDQPATSVGCEHGANPTAWSTRITAIDRYQGTPNIEAAKAPVEGRSGGGLFNAAGQLVGVCNAADPQRDEGLYASLPSIYAKLDALKLAFVYEAPSLGTAQLASAASMTKPSDSAFELRGQNPVAAVPTPYPTESTNATGPPAALAASQVPATARPEAGLLPEDRATLQELNRRGAGAEVICIINHPGGASEVIKLNRASLEFQRALGSQQVSATPIDRVAGAAGQPVGSAVTK